MTEWNEDHFHFDVWAQSKDPRSGSRGFRFYKPDHPDQMRTKTNPRFGEKVSLSDLGN